MTDIRQQSTKVIANALEQASRNSTSTIKSAISVAQILEQTVFEEHQGDTGNAYRTQMRSLALDLGKNNIELAQQLLEGQVDPKNLIKSGPEALKSAKQAQQDEDLRRQNLREAMGQEKIPVTAGGGSQQGPMAATSLSDEGEVGLHEASMGEEGDFKARNQPKIQGLEGIEFESGL